jgi:TusA-related sulfurtransferase
VTNDWKAGRTSMKKPHSRLDLRGAISPLSLLKATKALGDLGAGQRLEILSTDDRTHKELSEILNPEQFRTVEVQKRKTYYRMILEKAPSHTASSHEDRERL